LEAGNGSDRDIGLKPLDFERTREIAKDFVERTGSLNLSQEVF
jgi:hypothetical protein